MGDRYTLNAGVWGSVFAVPTALADNELRMASGAQLKVMLYLLRHSGEETDIEQLARYAGLSGGDTVDAIIYWKQRGLISERRGELVPAEQNGTSSETEAAAYEAPVQTELCGYTGSGSESIPAQTDGDAAAKLQPGTGGNGAGQQEIKPRRRERVRYSYDECTGMLAENSELGQMLQVLERLLGKQLNHTEISVFVTLVVWYGLPSACVAMLVEYCRSIGKCSIAYIEQTGTGWAQEEITTIEQADAKIKRLRAQRASWTKLRDIAGIPERKPTETEQRYSQLWINEWRLSDDLIKLAYDRCVDKKGKLSFSYMNGILKRWNESGLDTVEAVLASEQEGKGERKTSAANGGRYAPTYDISEIERQLDLEWMNDGDDTDA